MARTVLLADDSVTAQNMGRRILIDAGYEVVTVNNGSAALKRIHESPPDLIVLDVYMPGYGGLEVCQRLKESDETARIPILLTVGKMEPFKAEEAKRVRADAYIIKPFEASELLAALTKLEDRIVPQASQVRSRRSKPEKEKKTRSSRPAFDPAMSFDDTHSEKIAYLEQVKQRHAYDEPREEEHEALAEAEIDPAHNQQESQTPVEQSDTTQRDMPRPMSVYAAEELREMPVVAEPAPAQTAEEIGYEQPASSIETESTEQDPVGAVSESVVPAEEHVPASTNAESEVAEAPQAEQQTSTSEEIEITSTEQQRLDAASVDPQLAAIADAAPLLQTTEPGASIPPATEQVAARTRWVAENVAVSAEEAALELEREMHAQTTAEVCAGKDDLDAAELNPESPTLVAALPEAPAKEQAPAPLVEDTGATFAAAAAATGGTVAKAVPLSDPDPRVASETAAAWENWQHIRDSVMGSQTAVQLSESIVEAVQASSEPVAQSETLQASPHTSDQASENVNVPANETRAGETQADESDDTLSSIVDSVLAELKPKLMAEISKKLKK